MKRILLLFLTVLLFLPLLISCSEETPTLITSADTAETSDVPEYLRTTIHVKLQWNGPYEKRPHYTEILVYYAWLGNFAQTEWPNLDLTTFNPTEPPYVRRVFMEYEGDRYFQAPGDDFMIQIQLPDEMIQNGFYMDQYRYIYKYSDLQHNGEFTDLVYEIHRVNYT